MKKIFFFWVLWIVASSSLAQIDEVQKLEIPIDKKRGDDYTVINLKEKGIITILESREILRKMKQEVIFTKYDTAFQEQWHHSIQISHTERIYKFYVDQDEMWFLIKKPNYDYRVFRLNTVHGKAQFIDYKKIINLDVKIFRPANGLLYLGGVTDNKPTVLRYDPTHKTATKVLSSINQLRANIKEIIPNPSDNSVYVLLAYPYHSRGKIYVNRYDSLGKLLSNTVVSALKDYRILTWQPYLLKNKELCLFGTYAVKSRGKAQGVYVGQPESAKKTFRFYDFSSMKKFYHYLPDKKRNKVKEKINDKQKRRRLYMHDKNIFIRDLRITPNRIFMVGESYQPVYDRSAISNPMWNMGTYGRYRLNRFHNNHFKNSQFFENKRKPIYYRYKHMNIWAFDLETHLLWDNCLALKDSEVPYPQALTQFYIKHDSLTMMYINRDKIFASKVNTQEEVQKKHTFDLEPKDKDFPYFNRENEFLRYWYDDYFLLHDVRENKFAKNSENAHIFYIAKVRYEQ